MTEAYKIASIPLPNGSRIGIAPQPGLRNPLSDDLDVITNWYPQMLVSLTEPSEALDARSAPMSLMLEDRGIEWVQFPIRDFDVPSPVMTQFWAEVSARIHDCLCHGGSVLLHCRGGMGRSGMVALRLLRERGLSRRRSLGMVRSAQPGAIETEPQLNWGLYGFQGQLFEQLVAS
ncbi:MULTISPECIES: hypothetical protein [Pseudovibrio]|uniref:protein-tyrosine phosphatase family protein n=1 Tax=Stappiaceae TaxID=2821832 RepID=UPI002365DF82|nr:MULTISPECIES: hypothetical protein [Pseudovibrio]MDD7910855.1 hypothetical protein [Pseudovibrio exalbescens]MDX5593436.1 hypothetical protein [Pseudovibrio sp. SPO723]